MRDSLEVEGVLHCHERRERRRQGSAPRTPLREGVQQPPCQLRLSGSPDWPSARSAHAAKSSDVAEAIDPVEHPPREPGEALPVARIEEHLVPPAAGCGPRPRTPAIDPAHRGATPDHPTWPSPSAQSRNRALMTAAASPLADELLGSELTHRQQQHEAWLTLDPLPIGAQQAVVEQGGQILEHVDHRRRQRRRTRWRRASPHRRRC